MGNYKIEFVDKVIDSVHGFISLTEVEHEICKLGIFKRSGRIKQLSFANWVFPGAEHTRYTHSLGVMHIIDKMALKLKYTDEKRQILRIAALLHDIGHFPLSHDGEAAYRALEKSQIYNNFDIAEEKQKIKSEIDIACDRVNDIDIYFGSPSSSKFHHEQITKEIILNNKEIHEVLNNSACSDFINLEDICAIITGDIEYDNYRISDMVQLLNSELDADRIDYMMRDGFFSGTSYGDFGMGLLVDNLTKTKVKGKTVIGIKQQGIASGDQFLLNRVLSYEQVMYNKRVSSLAFMARRIMQYSISLGFIKSNDEVIKNILDNDFSYLMFTDNSFWNCVEKIYFNHENGEKIDDTIFMFCKNLINNNELKHDIENEVVLKANPKFFEEKVKCSKIYNNLENIDEYIPVFLTCEITKHKPIKIFEKHIENLPKEEQERLKLNRLMNGIAIINDNKTVNLLVDEAGSLMSTLYDTKLYLLREYALN